MINILHNLLQNLYRQNFNMMKKGHFSEKNLLQNSYKSLTKYKGQNLDNKIDQITKQILQQNKEPIRYSINKYNSNPIIVNNTQTNKNQQQLKKRIKVLEQQLLKKIRTDTILHKFLKTKNISELSHIDIYLEMNQLQKLLECKQQQLEKNMQKYNQLENSFQQIQKQNEQILKKSTYQIQKFTQTITTIQEKYSKKLQQSHIQLQNYQKDKILLKQLQKKNTYLVEQLQIQKQSHQLQILKLNNDHQTTIQQLEQINHKQKSVTQKFSIKLQQREKYSQQLYEEINKIKDKYQNKQTNLIKQHQEEIKQYQMQCQKEIQHLQKRYMTQYIEKQNKIMEKLKNVNDQYEEAVKNKQSLSSKLEISQKQLQNCKQKVGSLAKIEQQCKKQINQKQQQCKIYLHQMKALIFKKQETEAINSKLLQSIKTLTTQYQQCKNSLSERQTTLLQTKQKYDKLKQNMILNMTYNQNMQHSKIQTQNYKAIGRIIELNNKLCSYLDKIIPQDKQQLNSSVNTLGHLLNEFIQNKYLTLLKQIDSTRWKNNQVFMQLQGLISSLSSITQNQQLNNLLKQYFQKLKQFKNSTLEQSYQNLEHKRTCLQIVQQKIINIKATNEFINQKVSTIRNQSIQNTNEYHNESIRKYSDSLRKNKFKVNQNYQENNNDYRKRFQSTSQTEINKQNNFRKSNTKNKNYDSNAYRQMMQKKYFPGKFGNK